MPQLLRVLAINSLALLMGLLFASFGWADDRSIGGAPLVPEAAGPSASSPSGESQAAPDHSGFDVDQRARLHALKDWLNRRSSERRNLAPAVAPVRGAASRWRPHEEFADPTKSLRASDAYGVKTLGHPRPIGASTDGLQILNGRIRHRYRFDDGGLSSQGDSPLELDVITGRANPANRKQAHGVSPGDRNVMAREVFAARRASRQFDGSASGTTSLTEIYGPQRFGVATRDSLSGRDPAELGIRFIAGQGRARADHSKPVRSINPAPLLYPEPN